MSYCGLRLDPQQQELIEALQKLSHHGRIRTEVTLRRTYEQGNDFVRGEAARFLYQWRSSRRFVVADDWIAQGPCEHAFNWILVCHELAPGKSADGRFLQLFERSGLSDEMIRCLIDRYGSYMECRRGMAKTKAIDIIARYGDHPSPEVRWIVAFRLGVLKATSQRELLIRLAMDITRCSSGFISRVAKNALAYIDGRVDVDLHDASEP